VVYELKGRHSITGFEVRIATITFTRTLIYLASIRGGMVAFVLCKIRIRIQAELFTARKENISVVIIVFVFLLSSLNYAFPNIHVISIRMRGNCY
jgi:hypothetical protein